MIIDRPALLALLGDEPESRSCADAIEGAAIRRICTANLLEATTIIDLLGGCNRASSSRSRQLSRSRDLH